MILLLHYVLKSSPANNKEKRNDQENGTKRREWLLKKNTTATISIQIEIWHDIMIKLLSLSMNWANFERGANLLRKPPSNTEKLKCEKPLSLVEFIKRQFQGFLWLPSMTIDGGTDTPIPPPTSSFGPNSLAGRPPPPNPFGPGKCTPTGG
jgi:hypothetical protein